MSLFRHTGTIENSIATLRASILEGQVRVVCIPRNCPLPGHAKRYLVPLEAVLMAAWARLSRLPVGLWANAGGNFGPIHVFQPSDGEIAWLP